MNNGRTVTSGPKTLCTNCRLYTKIQLLSYSYNTYLIIGHPHVKYTLYKYQL